MCQAVLFDILCLEDILGSAKRVAKAACTPKKLADFFIKEKCTSQKTETFIQKPSSPQLGIRISLVLSGLKLFFTIT